MNRKHGMAFLLLAGGMLMLAAAEKDFSEVDIEEEFYPYMTARKNTMKATGVKEFLTPDKKRLIVCVVSTRNKGKNGSAMAQMIKVCRIKAQVELLKANGYKVSAFTKVEEQVVQTSDGQEKKIKSLSNYLNVAEEKVDGVVRSWPVIGTWFSKDGKEFYLAIGAVLKE
ncbi:MAG: hypothetical protein E7055_00415 [Lentisphaerae bacterium]|nr:hypothetical protein [Lentisphaerota bacterium]